MSRRPHVGQPRFENTPRASVHRPHGAARRRVSGYMAPANVSDPPERRLAGALILLRLCFVAALAERLGRWPGGRFPLRSRPGLYMERGKPGRRQFLRGPFVPELRLFVTKTQEGGGLQLKPGPSFRAGCSLRPNSKRDPEPNLGPHVGRLRSLTLR